MRTKYTSFILASLAVVITFLAFLPVLTAGFTGWDDQIMITQNPKIMSLSAGNVARYFTSTHERLYHPLVLISYAIEYRFFGLNPIPYHVTNLVLHLISCALVFWAFRLLTGRDYVAFIVAVLFGIHPMHVESVAWLAERKDVLYTPFFIAAMISYIYYLQKGERKHLSLTLLFFIISLLSKSMAFTLPFVMLLLDRYMECRIDNKTFKDKAVFWILAFLFGLITVVGHYEAGVKGREFTFSPARNLMAPFEGIVFYLIKLFLPFRLSAIYPLMPHEIAGMKLLYLLSPLIVIALAAAIWRYFGKNRTVVFGTLFFLATIFPVLQLVPVGLMMPADRYTYVPYIGLFFIAAVWFDGTISKLKDRASRTSMIAILALVIAVLSVLTFQRTGVWKNGIALWDDVLGNYPGIALAHYNRATEYFLAKGDLTKGLQGFKDTVKIDPGYVEAYVNMGLIYYYKNDLREAIVNYDKAEKLNPNMYEIYVDRGNAYKNLGMTDRAILEYAESLKLKSSPETWYNMGNIYLGMKEYHRAAYYFSQALIMKPDYPDALNNRGIVFLDLGLLDAARRDLNSAVAISPGYAEAYYNRAMVLAAQKDYRGTLTDLLKAKSLGLRVPDQMLEKAENLAR